METLVLVLHVFLSITLIGLVLVQQGKGADAGASFGGGASASVFGSRGSANFLTRATTIVVICFFATSITLFVMAANRHTAPTSVIDEAPAAQAPEVPADGGTVETEEAVVPASD